MSCNFCFLFGFVFVIYVCLMFFNFFDILFNFFVNFFFFIFLVVGFFVMFLINFIFSFFNIIFFVLIDCFLNKDIILFWNILKFNVFIFLISVKIINMVNKMFFWRNDNLC